MAKKDQTFCADIVNLRVAELLYRLNRIDESLNSLMTCELFIKQKDKYMIHLLRGKCYDKQKNFSAAMSEYLNAEILCLSKAATVTGNIYYRLGWAQIRSRKEVEKGIANLEKANSILPQNSDIVIKLATSLFQECGDLPETNAKMIDLLSSVSETDTHNFTEVLILRGKIAHRSQEYESAITFLEEALQV